MCCDRIVRLRKSLGCLPLRFSGRGFDSRRLHSPVLQGIATSRGTQQNRGFSCARPLACDSQPVTDAAVAALEKFGANRVNRNEQGEIVFVDLSVIQVTDAGLEHLKGLANLDVLVLAGTDVTDTGVAELKKALSKCDIRR